MSSVDLVVYGLLWLVFAVGLLLLLLLYRQVEKAYDVTSVGNPNSLAAGSKTPTVDVIGPDGQAVTFDASERETLTLLAFVTTSCPACDALLKLFADGYQPAPFVALVNGDMTTRFKELRDTGAVELNWLAHPPDAIHRYGVSRVPLVYAIQDGKVLGSRSAVTRQDVERLLDEVATADANPPPVLAGTS